MGQVKREGGERAERFRVQRKDEQEKWNIFLDGEEMKRQ